MKCRRHFFILYDKNQLSHCGGEGACRGSDLPKAPFTLLLEKCSCCVKLEV